MPNIKSAKKRVQVIEKKTLRNNMIKSEYKTAVKKFEAAVAEGDKAKAQEAYWQKHPEERPVPEEEKEPEPKEIDYLKRIAELLEAQNAPAPKAEKKEPAKKNK